MQEDKDKSPAGVSSSLTPPTPDAQPAGAEISGTPTRRKTAGPHAPYEGISVYDRTTSRHNGDGQSKHIIELYLQTRFFPLTLLERLPVECRGAAEPHTHTKTGQNRSRAAARSCGDQGEDGLTLLLRLVVEGSLPWTQPGAAERPPPRRPLQDQRVVLRGRPS